MGIRLTPFFVLFFFCPSLAATDVGSGNMQFFVDFGTRTVLKRLLLQPPIGYFFNFSFFFVPSLKRRLILSFVSLFSCITCLFKCSAVITLVRFFVHKFFFVFPQIRHSGFGRLYQSSDALVGGIVGIRLTPSFVIYFFLAILFFPITQRKIISLSLSAANVAG